MGPPRIEEGHRLLQEGYAPMRSGARQGSFGLSSAPRRPHVPSEDATQDKGAAGMCQRNGLNMGAAHLVLK